LYRMYCSEFDEYSMRDIFPRFMRNKMIRQ
jgi:hypothetical protein